MKQLPCTGVGAPGAVSLPNPTKFRLAASAFPWHTDFLLDARVEDNNHANQDGIVIYDAAFGTGGSWDALYRVTGWYEDAVMDNGPMEASVDILVSEYHSVSDAQHAFNAEVQGNSYRQPVSRPQLGSKAVEFSSSGMSSGHRVEDSIYYMRYRNIEVDVAVFASHKPNQGFWRSSLRVAARSLATQMMRLARS
jgi:hypothetical protein